MEEKQGYPGQILFGHSRISRYVLKYKFELDLRFMSAKKDASYIFKVLSLPMIHFNKSFILSKK